MECDVCGDVADGDDVRTYAYSEDGVIIFETDMCENCGDKILPVFFDAVGYGTDDETIDWPDTVDRFQESSTSSTTETSSDPPEPATR